MNYQNKRQQLDIDLIRHLLESHQDLTGMSYGLYDATGNSLITVGWQDLCLRYHQVNPVSCANSCECAHHIKKRLSNSQDNFLEYRCKNGMVDIAIPIITEGAHVATLYSGHFFYDDDLPDKELYLTQAWTHGFDPENYLKALEDVPVFSREFVRKNELFLRNLLNVLTNNRLGYVKHTRSAEET
jgi:ligand-binding sensor protein